MNKTIIIIQREYFSRVRKKSFLLLTFLTPILIAGIYAFVIWMMTKKDTERRTVGVINQSFIENPVESSEFTTFVYLSNISFDEGKRLMENKGYYALLIIPENILETNEAELFSYNQVTIEIKSSVQKQICKKIEKFKRSKIIAKINIPDLEKKLASTHTFINLSTIKIGEGGEAKQSSTEIAVFIGFISSFIIYLFIFLYGVQVMRGVIEEKSSRIVEVIISSVKPFQLMMGKIIGVAMVSLTQFILWVILTAIIIIAGTAIFIPNIDIVAIQQAQSLTDLPAGSQSISPEQFKIMQAVFGTLDLSYIAGIIGAFVFFFLFGYLLYSALFAAVGSAVDNETETQQFMLPITIPLIFALYIGFAAARNPEGSLAFWSSMIPFTSPIVMLVRVAYGVPAWELITSMVLLILTFLAITWMAAKIYRTGILMYGKKVSYKELWKWLFCNN